MRFLFYAVAVGLPILDIATLVEMGGWIGVADESAWCCNPRPSA